MALLELTISHTNFTRSVPQVCIRVGTTRGACPVLPNCARASGSDLCAQTTAGATIQMTRTKSKFHLFRVIGQTQVPFATRRGEVRYMMIMVRPKRVRLVGDGTTLCQHRREK